MFYKQNSRDFGANIDALWDCFVSADNYRYADSAELWPLFIDLRLVFVGLYSLDVCCIQAIQLFSMSNAQRTYL